MLKAIGSKRSANVLLLGTQPLSHLCCDYTTTALPPEGRHPLPPLPALLSSRSHISRRAIAASTRSPSLSERQPRPAHSAKMVRLIRNYGLRLTRCTNFAGSIALRADMLNPLATLHLALPKRRATTGQRQERTMGFPETARQAEITLPGCG